MDRQFICLGLVDHGAWQMLNFTSKLLGAPIDCRGTSIHFVCVMASLLPPNSGGMKQCSSSSREGHSCHNKFIRPPLKERERERENSY